MKKLSSIILFIAVSFLTHAQEWQTDFQEASKLAKEENKKLLMVFQGSDWCAPCMNLDAEVWQKKEFEDYAKENFVLLQVDFPKKTKNKLSAEQQEKNTKLADKYNPNGIIPLVIVFDDNGKKLGELGYKKVTPAEYITIIDSF